MVNVLDSAVFPISVSGGGVYRTLINEETTLTDSGHYYSNSLVSDTNINAGSLTSGKQVLWFNDSSNNVIFSGLTSIGGVAIPENQGVKITPSNYIEFTVDSTGVITKNRGTHTIDWLAGLQPSTLTFNHVSNGDTNGIIYYLGATKYNASFINPVTRGEITVAASSVNGSYTPDKVFNRVTDTSTFTSWFSSSSSSEVGWLEFNFNNHQCRINRLTIRSTWIHSFYYISPFTIEAWNGSNWIQLFSAGSDSSGSLAYYDSGVFTNPYFYSKYRYRSGFSDRQVVFDELEVYGELTI